MNCPHCNEANPLPQHAIGNLYSYYNQVLAACVHCSRPITCTPITYIRLDEYLGDATEDDWGADFKKEETEKKE